MRQIKKNAKIRGNVRLCGNMRTEQSPHLLRDPFQGRIDCYIAKGDLNALPEIFPNTGKIAQKWTTFSWNISSTVSSWAEAVESRTKFLYMADRLGHEGGMATKGTLDTLRF